MVLAPGVVVARSGLALLTAKKGGWADDPRQSCEVGGATQRRLPYGRGDSLVVSCGPNLLAFGAETSVGCGWGVERISGGWPLSSGAGAPIVNHREELQ
jgi:hypothetical protein